MKRIILLICVCMLLTALSGQGFADTLEEAAPDKQGQNGLGVSVSIEGVAGSAKMVGSASKSNAAAQAEPSLPSEGSILDIAKKYYDRHSNALQSGLKGEFSREAGAVGFDGDLRNAASADALCDAAMAIAAFGGDGDYAVAAAAAAVGLSGGNARSVSTLAAVLEAGGFIADGARLNDAARLAEHAASAGRLDANALIRLAQTRLARNDLDGALEAINAALDIEPGDNLALTIKIEILTRRAGPFPSVEGQRIGKALRENDGELSKRLAEQERATEGMERVEDGDGKEEVLRKMEQFYNLEPITPADMMEIIFPEQSRKIRRQVNTVSASDKSMLTDNFPVFPNGLFRTMRQAYDMQDEIEGYWNWVSRAGDYRANNIYYPAENEADAAKAQRGSGPSIKYSENATSLDYMWEYNLQILKQANYAFGMYRSKLSDEFFEESLEINDKKYRKAMAAFSTFDASAKREEDLIALELTCNEAYDIYFKEIIPLISKTFDEMKRASERHWERMLPFARATEHPESNIIHLYADAVEDVWDILETLSNVSISAYYPDVSPADLEAVEAAQEALKELMAQQASAFYDVTNGFTISAELGPLEFKLSNTKVEVEFVLIVAARSSYDWKSQELEIGAGVGEKFKVGVAGAGTGVEAKAYTNVVIDLRKKDVTDIYFSAEAKGSFVGFEAGGQGRASIMGHGTSLSTSAKQKFGSFAIEHETEIIKSGSTTGWLPQRIIILARLRFSPAPRLGLCRLEAI